MKESRIEIVAVNTTMEHPEILDRINKNADRVLQPVLDIDTIKKNYGIPCFSKFQDEMIERYQNGSRTKNTMDAVTGNGRIIFKLNNKARTKLLDGTLHKVSSECCKYIKKKPMLMYEKETKKRPIICVRRSESRTRKAKYTSCFTKSKEFTPIFDLTDELLREIEKAYNIEVPKVYSTLTRTGCMGCPYGFRGGKTKLELDLISESQRTRVINYFKDSYNVLGVKYEEELCKK